MKYINTQYKIFESEINNIIKKCEKYNIEKYDINDDGSLTVYGDVNFKKLKLKRLPLIFNEVWGDFVICDSNIKTLKGSPKIIHGNLEFELIEIENLKFCPKEIYGCFINNFNIKLNYFIDFPEFVGKGVDFSYCNLKSLYGCNVGLNGFFIIKYNSLLKELKYGPKHVDGTFDCTKCGLITLYGAPKYVGKDFYCNKNKINSLKYSPQHIGGDMFFRHNNIKSFEHFPNYVGGGIYCENTPVYEIWKLFEDKNKIEYFNQMKIIKNDTVNIKKLNLFLKSIGKNPVENVNGYVNI